MANSKDLVNALRAELREAGITYAQLASRLNSSESTVKRMFSQQNMSLERLDQILAALGCDLVDLSRRIAEARVQPNELDEKQEAALVADRRRLLVALCCQSEWRFEQMLQYYAFEPTELIGHLVALDKIGLIRLRQNNRYQLLLAKGFRWRPHGPVMAYFREHAMSDYFSGGFDAENESLSLVHGSISRAAAPEFTERLQRLARDFSRQHLVDHTVADAEKLSYTMVLAMRQWLFRGFEDMER